MKKLLYVDSCIRRDTSRTEKLAQAYLEMRRKESPCKIETLILENAGLRPLDGRSLARRDQWIASGDYSDACFDLARSFAAADELVIAAPYWDLSFPSMLKVYLEHICINGLTFRYGEQGRPEGLTHISGFVYISTAGGYFGQVNLGFDYVKNLLQNLFCIGGCRFIGAEGLDVWGNDPDAILRAAIAGLHTEN